MPEETTDPEFVAKMFKHLEKMARAIQEGQHQWNDPQSLKIYNTLVHTFFFITSSLTLQENCESLFGPDHFE